ncbi:MAG: hypothetical protein PHV36_14890 [Elusimicrobiales bacterium]|nr:hypothetical protein [Elusimicrobiales bacterium]
MRNKRGIMSLIFLAMVFANVPGISADDESSITFVIHNSTDTAKDTPAEVMLTDNQGRRTGFDASAPFNDAAGITGVNEIPGSGYSIQGIGDESGEENDEPFYRELYVPEPLPGKYTLQIIGRQTGGYLLSGGFYDSNHNGQHYDASGFIVSGQTVTINLEYSPTPGAPAPVVVKTVTFDVMRQDLTAAQQLKQLGDDKFVRSLVKTVDLAGKLSAMCDKRKHSKDKGCEPAVAVLKLFVKRLEKANQKCDSKNSRECDEDKDWDDFNKGHRKDHDYDDFFRDWDRDDWHKHKKQCKRFVADEAFKIIKEDTQWLIKSLGGKVDKEHDHHGGEGKGR